MSVTVVYTTQVKAALGVGSEEITLATPCMLGDLLDHLVERHGPTFRDLVLDQRQQLLPSILVCVGSQQVEADRQLALKDGDEVTLLSAISGG